MKKIKDDSGGLQSILLKKKYYIDMPDSIHCISDVLSIVKPRAFMLKIELRYKMLNLARHSIYMRWKHLLTILTTKLEGAQNEYNIFINLLYKHLMTSIMCSLCKYVHICSQFYLATKYEKGPQKDQLSLD